MGLTMSLVGNSSLQEGAESFLLQAFWGCHTHSQQWPLGFTFACPTEHWGEATLIGGSFVWGHL